MAEAHFIPDADGSTKRPDLIAVVGVFTFINTGLFTLVYGFGSLAMLVASAMPVEEYVALMRDSTATWLPDESTAMMEEMGLLLHESGVLLMFILLLRTVLRGIGALGMWKGRRWGFQLYSAAQLGGIFAPHLVLPWVYLGFIGPLLAVSVTALYGTQLKRLQ